VRRAQPERWEEIVSRYREGQIVPGQITKLAPFGAFVRLEGPIEGLIHISELVDRRITHPKEVVEEGDVVPVKIVRIEYDRHRLGLSLRQARDRAEEDGWSFNDGGSPTTVPQDALDRLGVAAAPVREPSDEATTYPQVEAESGMAIESAAEETQATAEPEAADVSEADAEPAAAEEPEASAELEAAEDPEAAAEPLAAEEPEAAAAPGTAEEPEASAEPEAAQEPEAAVEPEAAEESAASAEPEAAQESEVETIEDTESTESDDSATLGDVTEESPEALNKVEES
jgi:small subunit ribosomal protein S1